MKKVALSVLAVVFAAASVMANGNVPVKNKKQTTCTHCKDKCAKSDKCKNKCSCK